MNIWLNHTSIVCRTPNVKRSKKTILIRSVQEMNVVFAEITFLAVCPGLCFCLREAGLIDSSKCWDMWVNREGMLLCRESSCTCSHSMVLLHPQALVVGFFPQGPTQLLQMDIVESRTAAALFVLPVHSLHLARKWPFTIINWRPLVWTVNIT